METGELRLLDLGIFDRETISDIIDVGKDYDCGIVVKSDIYLRRLINEAVACGCCISCNGSILRLFVSGIANVEYWTSLSGIRICGFKLYLWSTDKINKFIILAFESYGESYISGLCNSRPLESYIDRRKITLLWSRYSGKLLWECIS